MIARIGGDHRVVAMGLCIDNDLRFLIDGRDTGITLYHAFAGGHFGGFIIGAIGEANAVLAAPAIFAGIRREFDAIDGEHLAPDQALVVADQEDLREQFGDGVAHAGDKGSECGEVRLAVARDGNENTFSRQAASIGCG